MNKTKEIKRTATAGKARVIEQLHCYRCGFDWYPKQPGKVPTVCARCKNPRWDIPRPQDETGKVTGAEERAIADYLTLLRARGPHVKAIRLLIEAEVERMTRGGAEG
jgi:hypothetical protein